MNYDLGPMRSVEDLEQEFENACRKAVEECKRFDYNPTIWISMMRDMGAVAAAQQLLTSPNIQSGFERLIREGRPDLSIEFAVLHPKWGPLFLNDHREAAWWRLERAARGDL